MRVKVQSVEGGGDAGQARGHPSIENIGLLHKALARELAETRLAAIKAVTDTGATFQTGQQLRLWLNSEAVAARSAQPDWPTAETKTMWVEFARSFTPRDNHTWSDRRYWVNAAWQGAPPLPGTRVQLHHWNGRVLVLSADGTSLGTVHAMLNPTRSGLLRAQVSENVERIDLSYLGPDDLTGV